MSHYIHGIGYFMLSLSKSGMKQCYTHLRENKLTRWGQPLTYPILAMCPDN